MRRRLLRAFVSLLLISVPAAAEELASLYSAEGDVSARKQQTWVSATVGMSLEPSDSLRTGKLSRAAVRFTDGYLVRLNEGSTLELSDPSGTALRLESGKAYLLSRDPSRAPVIETPLVTAAVRGTELVVDASADRVIVSVLEGQVDCSNSFGSVSLAPGEEAYTLPGRAPVKRIMLNPRDAVQWAVYYPALLSTAEISSLVGSPAGPAARGFEALSRGDTSAAAGAFPGDTPRERLGRAILAYRAGELGTSMQELRGISGADRDQAVRILESSLELAAGRVSASTAILDSLDANAASPTATSLILSQRALLLLAANEKQEAKRVAEEAYEVKPTASAALIASYVAQSWFDLVAAREWLDRAMDLAPESAFLYARRAELALGTGHVREAYEDARRAYSLSPGDPYIISVLGFAELARLDAERALELFVKAAEADRSSGLPHLGLGLSLIRMGRLEDGRRELENAVLLEPMTSLYRSYLGKAFFEEDRYGVAARELARAKELDPNDPTPYVYSAFNKLASFQPVAAIRELESSIALNDYRAVYRSQLLLDQDLAVRGTGLATVFTSVSFPEVGRQEALKSLSRDYGNHSAHRLLAESNGAVSTLAQASITENTLADILSPVTFNDILPNLAGDASLNEYTVLFDRPSNRTLLQGSYRTGDDNILGEIIQAGAEEDFAYRLRYTGSVVNGFENNTEEHTNLLRGLFKFQITPDQTASIDAGVVHSQRGDSLSTFGFDDPETDPDLDIEAEALPVSASYHYRFAPNAHFLSLLGYNHNQLKRSDRDAPGSIVVRLPTGDLTDFTVSDTTAYTTVRATRFNNQLIWDSDLVSVVAGAELLDAQSDSDDQSDIKMDSLGLFTGSVTTTSGKNPEDAASGYLYTTWHMTDWADLALAGNYSGVRLSRAGLIPPFENGVETISRFSPKIGLNLYPNERSVARVAYFETLGNSGVGDLESLEPSTIASVTQLIDELPGATTRNISAGFDYKFPTETYTGFEAIYRNTTVPVFLSDFVVQPDFEQGTLSTDIETRDLEQHNDIFLTREYLYQIVGDRTTVTLEHMWSTVEDNLTNTFSRNHRVRAGLNYFDPSGLFAFASTTWRYQDLDGFLPENQNGTNDFFIANIGLGWQLPERRGSVAVAVQNLFDQTPVFRNTGTDGGIPPEAVFAAAFSVNF